MAGPYTRTIFREGFVTKIYWVRWYPKLFIGSSWYAGLKHSSRLLYRELIDHQAARSGEPLPAEPEELLLLLSGWTSAQFKSAWPPIEKKFELVPGGSGRLNAKMGEEVSRSLEACEKNAARTAAARAAKEVRRLAKLAAAAEKKVEKEKVPDDVGKVADYFAKGIKFWKHDARVTVGSPSSLKSIELMLRKDGRSAERVAEVLKFLFGGEYEGDDKFDWRPNIMSGTSLRKAFDRLDELEKASGGSESGGWSGH